MARHARRSGAVTLKLELNKLVDLYDLVCEPLPSEQLPPSETPDHLPRFGYRRLHVLPRREGRAVNKKRSSASTARSG